MPSSLLMMSGGRYKPVIVQRSQLVLPGGAFSTQLPWTPPKSRDFLRADSWACTMPGYPWVPGASTRHPERVLSWFLDRYATDLQVGYLKKYASYGYTHLKLSLADSMGSSDTKGNTRPPGNEQTLDQFIRTCQRVKEYLPYVQVVIGSKYFDELIGHSQPLDVWKAYVDPILDKLFAAKCVDEVIPGWEWDLWNQGTPGPVTISVFKYIGRRCHDNGVSCWTHFAPHVTSWQADGTDRFQFWKDLGDDVDGINYQTQPEWTIRETQDRVVDTLWFFGQEGNRWKFRFDEDQAALQWDNDLPDEAMGTARGYLACCTYDNVRHTDARVWGYGNGGSLVDGWPL